MGNQRLYNIFLLCQVEPLSYAWNLDEEREPPTSTAFTWDLASAKKNGGQEMMA
jgi:hypothetical protein